MVGGLFGRVKESAHETFVVEASGEVGWSGEPVGSVFEKGFQKIVIQRDLAVSKKPIIGPDKLQSITVVSCIKLAILQRRRWL